MSAGVPEFPVWGLMAEFGKPSDLVEACHKAYAAGYRNMDAYSPYPIEEAAEAIGFHRNALPSVVLFGGIVGLIAGLALQVWVSAVAYPLNVGGRPLLSWPAFVPPAFETTILFAALSAVLGMLALNGLPQPYHPVFNVPQFKLATTDRFFLCIEATDPRFDLGATRKFLEELEPLSIAEVAP